MSQTDLVYPIIAFSHGRRNFYLSAFGLTGAIFVIGGIVNFAGGAFGSGLGIFAIGLAVLVLGYWWGYHSRVELSADGLLTIVNPYSSTRVRLSSDWQLHRFVRQVEYSPPELRQQNRKVRLRPLNPQMKLWGGPSKEYEPLLEEIAARCGRDDVARERP